MTLSAFNWLEQKWSAAGDLAPQARLALFRRCRLATAALNLCFFPPMVLLGAEPMAVVASLLLFGALPAVIALDARHPDALNRAILMGLIASTAVLCAGMLRGLHPLLALCVLATVTIEAVIAGKTKIRRLALGLLIMSTAAVAAGSALPQLMPVQEGISLSAVALATVLVMNIAMITHGLRSGLAAQETARDGEQDRLTEAESIVSEMVIAVNRSGSVLRVSGNSERVLGLAGETLLGRGLSELVLVADRPHLLTLLCDCAHGGPADTLRVRLRVSADREAPRYRWIEARIAPAPGSKDTAVAALRDISAQVEDEERNATITAEAGAARDARAAFLSTVNHELRTPLNAIIGFSELLANPITSPQNPERLQEYARLINGAGHDLLRMVTVMIDVTRIDSGIYEFEAEQADLKPVIESAIDAFRQEPEGKDATITFNAPTEALNASIDQRAFRQVLNQLLSNAAKFSGSAAPVQVVLKPDGEWIQIAISDKGPGISEEKLQKLGRHFERLDEGLSRERGGVGLGLSLASGLMALHGGKVAISSKQGAGTTVTLSLLKAGAATPSLPSNIHTLAKQASTTLEATTENAASERLRA